MTTVDKAAHWPVSQEHELVPYSALPVASLQSLLVLAPHPDDEVFGCGGLLALAMQQRLPCHVVVATDGGRGGDAHQREAESRAAALVLAQHSTHSPAPNSASNPTHNPAPPTSANPTTPYLLRFWREPDRGLLPNAALSARIANVALESNSHCVLAPSPFEVHPDHRALCRAAVLAMPAIHHHRPQAQLVFYEVGQTLMPNAFIDITSVHLSKARAMQCFASQLAGQNYAAQVEGLNRQRSYTLGPPVTHAEGYWFVPTSDLAGGVDGVLAGLARALRQRL